MTREVGIDLLVQNLPTICLQVADMSCANIAIADLSAVAILIAINKLFLSHF